MKIKFTALLSLSCIVCGAIQGAPSTIDRAKTLVRGAQMYRKQTLPRLYDFLEIVGMGKSARKLQASIEAVEQVQAEIEAYLEKTLNSTELDLRTSNKATLERQQIFMTAKVLNEINKLFDTLDNIMGNVAIYVRNFRQEQQKTEPAYNSIKQEIQALNDEIKSTGERIIKLRKTAEPQLKAMAIDTDKPEYESTLEKVAPEMPGLKAKYNELRAKASKKDNQKKMLEKEFLPVLKEYYNNMVRDSFGLFNLAKSLGTSMAQKASTELAQVETLNKILEDQKKNFTSPNLLKKLAAAQKQLDTTNEEINKEITSKLSDTEQRLWGILNDLYQRVLLTESIILQGPKPIENWTLPKVLGIKLPETTTAPAKTTAR